MKRCGCFVTEKFGKDVASLIHFWAWKMKLNHVNQEYHSLFRCVTLRFRGKHKCVKFGDNFFFINSRHIDDMFPVLGWNCVTAGFGQKECEFLPANYWHIKELY